MHLATAMVWKEAEKEGLYSLALPLVLLSWKLLHFVLKQLWKMTCFGFCKGD